MTLPDIPRLYTALAEVLAVLVYAQAAPPRAAKPVTYAATAGWAAVLGVFLQLTGSVPLAWWLPCMVAAIAWLYLYLWGTRDEFTGSRLQLRPRVHFGGAGRQRGVAAPLRTLAAAAGYSTAFGTAAGGGLHSDLRLFVLV